MTQLGLGVLLGLTIAVGGYRRRALSQSGAIAAAAWCMALRIRGYVPQRQMFPAIAASMSASVGLGVALSSATALMTWPDWQ